MPATVRVVVSRAKRPQVGIVMLLAVARTNRPPSQHAVTMQESATQCAVALSYALTTQVHLPQMSDEIRAVCQASFGLSHKAIARSRSWWDMED